jgi:hypothetical protein
MHQRKKADAKVSSPCFESQPSPLPDPGSLISAPQGRTARVPLRGLGEAGSYSVR